MLVDHLGSKYIGGKTLLCVVDGLFGGWISNGISSMPQKWSTLPQGGQPWWPSSLLVSQDPIAVDSVALDFLIGEVTQNGSVWLGNCADNYLIEGAQANNPPSGTFYDPDRTGTRLPSLGVHEHWNDAVHRQYSRNLGTAQGIELVSTATTTISVSPVNIPSGQTGTVNIVMNAQGTESAVGFQSELRSHAIAIRVGAIRHEDAGGYLMTNTTNAANGQVGFAIGAQPMGSTFTSGNLTILQVTFQAIGTTPTTTSVTFGDTPVIRQVVDVNAQILPSTFTGGTVTISSGLIITPSAGPNGSISPSTPQPATQNGNVTFNAIPNTNYVVDTWSVDNTVKQMGGTQFTLSGITASHSVHVTFKIPLSALALSITPPSPVTVNTPLQLTATPTGGASLEYKFYTLYVDANQKNQMVLIQDYRSQYHLQLYADCRKFLHVRSLCPRTGGNRRLRPLPDGDLYRHSSRQHLTAVSVTPSLASPQPPNTQITFTAVATGGMSVQFQYWLYNAAANPTWSQLQAYSTSATYQWTPATAGNYTISVTALDATGTTVNTLLPYSIGSPLTAVNVIAVARLTATAQHARSPSPRSATGGTSVQFQFWLYNPARTPAWSQLQAYSTSPTYQWTPSTAGNYVIAVTALDITGTSGNTLAAIYRRHSIDGSQRHAVACLAATAEHADHPHRGSDRRHQCAIPVLALQPDGNPTWSQLQAFSTTPTYKWTPTTPGNYVISVTAQDVTGTMVNTLLRIPSALR